MSERVVLVSRFTGPACGETALIDKDCTPRRALILAKWEHLSTNTIVMLSGQYDLDLLNRITHSIEVMVDKYERPKDEET